MNATKAISVITAILVLFLATGAFVLSYDALRALAASNGIKPGLTWLWPLLIDGAMIIFSLAVLRDSLLGERVVYPWLLVGAFVALSIAFNVIHASAALLPRVVAAIPPIALALSFELFTGQLKGEVKRQAATHSLAQLTASLAARQAELDNLATDIANQSARRDTLKDEIADLLRQRRASTAEMNTLQRARARRGELAQQAVDALLAFYATNPNATQAEAGEAVGRSRSWVGQQLAQLASQGAIERNGNGVQVN